MKLHPSQAVVVALLLVAAAIAQAGDAPTRINVFPQPTKVLELAGEFHFHHTNIIQTSPECQNEAQFMASLVRSGDSHRAKVQTVPSAYADIVLRVDPNLVDLGDEGYHLTVDRDAITILAPKPAGIFYGIQTVRQMLPAAIEDPKTARSADWSVPCAEITDKPRFAWRGMLLDVSRHFFPKPDIERFLDLLAMQKMNVFHWHLVDDGGWRIEIKKYPKLTSVGAWRTGSPITWDYQHLNFPGPGTKEKLYGGFYTQQDIKDIVKYAADRHITIVPEIEMPGHSLAALASYPELACNVPASAFTKESGMPLKNVYCAGKDSTFEFLQNVLDEVCALFPSQFIHIGGDEVDKFLWNHCPDCQKRMKDEKLANAEELQSYFIKRIETYLNSKGKRLIGWDEILEGGLAPNAAVMSWRGIDGGVTAAQSGHDVVMTPTSHCYFDYPYSNISTEHVLGFDPVPAALSADDATHILGGQCNLWTEMVPDMATAEQRLFPRILAMSEVLWSEQPEAPDDFMARLGPFYDRMTALGLHFYLPKPEADYDAVLLNGPSTVSFKAPPMTGSIIRYTTDGTEPTATSAQYTAPFTVDQPMTVTAALFVKGGNKSDSVKVSVVKWTPAEVGSLTPGLEWNIYDGQFSKVPAFSGATPSAHGIAPAVGLVGNEKAGYALQFKGFIKIDTEGVYTFSIGSDDGSTLSLGGAIVVDNDGLHGTIEKSGKVLLRPGVYPIEIGFFQAGGDQTLTASIEGPGLIKQSIPEAMLSH